MDAETKAKHAEYKEAQKQLIAGYHKRDPEIQALKETRNEILQSLRALIRAKKQ